MEFAMDRKEVEAYARQHAKLAEGKDDGDKTTLEVMSELLVGFLDERSSGASGSTSVAELRDDVNRAEDAKYLYDLCHELVGYLEKLGWGARRPDRFRPRRWTGSEIMVSHWCWMFGDGCWLMCDAPGIRLCPQDIFIPPQAPEPTSPPPSDIENCDKVDW